MTTIDRAAACLNHVVTDPQLTYEETRDGLLALQHHLAHLLTHFPERVSARRARQYFNKRISP